MNRRQIPYAVLLLVGLTTAVVMLEAPAALRIPVMLMFLLLGPGMAFVPLLRLEQKGYEFTLGMALSLVLEALIATVLVEMRIWTIELSLELLGSLCVVGCGLQILLPAPREEAAPPPISEDDLEWSNP